MYLFALISGVQIGLFIFIININIFVFLKQLQQFLKKNFKLYQ